MMDGWLRPEQVFDGKNLQNGVALRIEAGIVMEVVDAGPDAPTIGGCLAPGFVDLQVNGGGGVMLNSTPTVAGMTAIATAHRQFGTTAVMPTVITDAPDVLDRAANAAIEALDQNGIIGLHIEGPHIALEKRGTHAAEFVRPLDGRTMDVVARLRKLDVPVMITVAPEAATPEQIDQLAKLGAVVSLGHTNATADVMRTAIKAGARCGTHLFNAMSPLQSRAPGAVGAILEAGIAFGFICDGQHVDDTVLGLALRAAQPDCAFLVSDAMATVGGPPEFDLYGQTIRVEEGRLVNFEGNLAGAHVTQAQGVQRLVNNLGLTLGDALRAAITVPAKVVGVAHLASLEGRRIEDLIVISNDLSVRGTTGADLSADLF